MTTNHETAAPAATAVDHPIGSTVWQELVVPSSDGLADFYAAVLGWRLRLSDDGATGTFELDGRPVAGLRVDPVATGRAVYWRSYLGADDLDGAVDRAVTAGAVVRDAAAPILRAGRAAELTDPFGAWFGLAELEPGEATVQSTDLGRLVLVDPTCGDLDAMIAFQHALFPGAELDRMAHDINVFRDADGTALRGAYTVPEDVLPAHWLPWFAVADQRRATEIAAEHGGRINTVDNELSFGVWGVVVDPQGGEFKVLQMTADAV